MKLAGKISVEQLGEERLTNIERAIVAGAAERMAMPERASRHYFAFAATAFAAAAAGVIGWQLHREPAIAPPAAQQVAVATDPQHATLSLGDATVASSAGAQYEITRSDGRVEIALAKGRLELAVEHHVGRVLVVRAGDTEVEDVGTKFSVDYDGASHARVEVTEGEVKVTRHQQSQHVAAGSAWTTSDGVVAIADLPKPAAAAATPHDDIEIDAKPPEVLHEHHAAVPAEPAPAPAKHAPVAATAAPVHAEKAPPADPLRARIASHAPELVIDLPIEDYPMRAANENDLDQHANLLFSWAVKAYQSAAKDPKLYDLADHVLDGLVAKRAGTRYVDALWLRLRIRCRHGYDDRCHDTARDYIAANGPLSDIAQDILSATR